MLNCAVKKLQTDDDGSSLEYTPEQKGADVVLTIEVDDLDIIHVLTC